MPLLEDVAAYLATAGVGTVGTDIFRGEQPDAPDACIALFATEGRAPEPLTGTEFPGLQVRVRAATRSAAYTKAYAVFKALYNVTNATMGSTVYHRVDALGGVMQSGRDPKGRHECTVNFQIIKDME